jgi:CheY-like chemotaxis protein
LRVLVVDDNVDAAEMLSDLVASWGHEVTSVSESSRALDELSRTKADVVLLDIGMPGMDGHELARAIKRSGPVPAPLLVAVTGYGQERDRLAGFAAGFDEFLTKPVNPDELERLLLLKVRSSRESRAQ